MVPELRLFKLVYWVLLLVPVLVVYVNLPLVLKIRSLGNRRVSRDGASLVFVPLCCGVVRSYPHGRVAPGDIKLLRLLWPSGMLDAWPCPWYLLAWWKPLPHLGREGWRWTWEGERLRLRHGLFGLRCLSVTPLPYLWHHNVSCKVFFW